MRPSEKVEDNNRVPKYGVRSTNRTLRALEELEHKGVDPEDENDDELNEKAKWDYEENQRKVSQLTDAIKLLILKLSNFTSTYVGEKFFTDQYETVMDMLKRAFTKDENQSMLLLSRSNTVTHQFISKIKNNLIRELSTDDRKCNIKAIRINAILTTKETAILNHFAECLGMENNDKQILATDMQAKMSKYFEDHPEVSVLFIFENVEYYIENSKQSLLYKILDMFQHTHTKFAFIATSQQIDIIDQFEKRIKSRFSHRQILFYSEELSTFTDWIEDTLSKVINDKNLSDEGKEYINLIRDYIFDEDSSWMKVFKKLFNKGKDYEFLCRTLKIALSHLNSTYQSNPQDIYRFNDNVYKTFKKSLDYVDTLSTSNDFKTILSRMPEAYFAVLISGKNAFMNWKSEYFTFSLAYHEYKWFLIRNKGQVQIISKETFIKIFIDLISKGFFKSKNISDYTSVNNKLVLGIEENELHNMIKENLRFLGLSSAMENYVEYKIA